MTRWPLACYLALKTYFAKHALARVAGYVSLAHLLFLIFAIPKSSPLPPAPVTLLAVKTVRLAPGVKIADRTSNPKPAAPSKPTQAQEPAKPKADVPSESEPSHESQVEPKPTREKKLEKVKTLKPDAPAKKPKEKPKTAPKKEPDKPPTKKPNPVNSKKLANALKNLNQVKTGTLADADASSTKIAKASINSSNSIDLSEGTGSGTPTLSHEEAISQFLRLWVRLPEYGQVKIKLTIDGQGHVLDLKTLAWESETNRAFVEERLPKLIFPVAGNQGQRQASKTFTLVMRNE